MSFTLQERHPGDSKNYNECIRHETIRVAVCDMMEGKCPCPEPLRYVCAKSAHLALGITVEDLAGSYH